MIIRTTNHNQFNPTLLFDAYCDCGTAVRVSLKPKGSGGPSTAHGPFALGKTFIILNADGSWTCEGCGATNVAVA